MKIDEFQVGASLMVIAFGAVTAATIVDVDKRTESFTYVSDDASEQGTINLRCAESSKVPGSVYDVHKHGNVVVANFRSWQSGKYYADDYEK